MRRRPGRWLAIALAAACVSAATAARAQSDRTERDRPREIGLEERAGRSLAQIDITVVGPPEIVRSLTADDFKIRVQLERVDEFELDRLCGAATAAGTAGAVLPSAGPPGASYLFYFDQPHLTMGGRLRAIEIARALVDELISGGNRAMLVSNARRSEILEPLTTDRDALHARLDELAEDRDQWDLYAHNEDARVEEVVRSLND
ncbi:MAG TPA: hypothetical protein VD788_15320, partial [Candidatus Polarisedimenticolaceae bacterium]|nr:hypothetical protein [Candidatus Polarisedimenticolaceae bacterium]